MLVLAVGAAASARLGFVPDSCDPGQDGYGGYGGYSADCDAPPTARITMMPANPRAGGVVTFSADEPDPRHRYDWDLDGVDGFEITGNASPTATFPAGTATARLRVTDEFDRSVVAEETFEVHAGNERPTADFSFTPSAPRIGQPVTFYGGAADSDGTVTAAAFDFTDAPGCETPAEVGEWGVSTSFAFTSGGLKTVRLCVTDDAGASTVTTQTVEVHAENLLPRVSFFAPAGVRTGRSVSLSANGFDPDGAIAKFRWDLDGDKTNGYEVDSGTSSFRQHVFTTAGALEIGVKAIDADGAEAIDRAVVQVSDVNQPPTGFLSFGTGAPGVNPDVVDVNQGVTASIFPFDPDGDFMSPIALHWDVDGDDVVDFETEPQPSPRQIPGFPTPGERVIRVKATDAEGASKVFTRVLRVREPNTPPSASRIVVNNGMPGAIRVGDLVTFGLSAFDRDGEPLTYGWDLDGDAGNGFEYTPPQFGPPDASRTFDAPGRYTIRGRVRDERGGESVQSVDVTVFAADAANTIPSPAIYVMPEQPRTSSTVTVFASWLADAEGQQLHAVWDLDGDAQEDYGDADGSLNPTLPNVTLPGTYPVRLKVYEVEQDGVTPIPGGLEATTTQFVEFHEGNWKPIVQASCGGCEFGTVRVGQTITLSAFGNDYDGSVEQQAYDVNGDGDYDDAGIDVVQTYPQFGPVQVPLTQEGPLTLRVRATDDSGGFTEARVLLNVEPAAANEAPKPSIFALQNPGLQVGLDTPVELNAISGDPEMRPTTYAWDLDDDGAYDDGDQQTVTFPGKATAGSYVVRLKANDGEADGFATAVVKVVSGDTPPTISSVFGPKRVRIDRPVTWTVYPSAGVVWAPGVGVRKVEWELDGDGDFDDAVLEHTEMQGPIFSATTPPQTYEGPPRSITIGVRLTDAGGKTATATREIEITDRNLAPIGWMWFSPSPPVAGEAITFQAQASDPDAPESMQWPPPPTVTYAWDLDGDGDYGDAADGALDATGAGATGQIARRAFAETGQPTVGVELTDADGATHAIRETLRVGTERPDAQFTWAPQNPQAGQPVTFSNGSSDPDQTAVSSEWDFDEDGLRDFDDSGASNPTHTFEQPGTYRVALRVRDEDGDRATRYETVEVGGECDPCASIDQETAFPVKNKPVVLSAFTSDPDNGDAPVPGSGIAWDLPNGDAPAFDDATGTQVTIPSLAAGWHLVRVRVTDAEGRHAIDFIHVFVADDKFRPTVELEATPSSPSTGKPVTWTAYGYDEDGGAIVAYEFDRNGDGDFDDDGEDMQHSEQLVLTACSQVCTMRVGVRVKDSADQVSDPVWTEVEVHEGNIPPTVQLWANRDVAGVDALVRFNAYAYDEDDSSTSDNGILEYEWDFDYDPQAPDFAVGEATEERSFATARAYTVAVRVTDRNATAPETALATYTVSITSGNAEPQPRIYVWPNPIEANQPFNVTGDGNDPDGDEIVHWEWDVDGIPGYEAHPDQETLQNLLLTSTGVKTLKLRVTDARGKTGETSLQVNVVNAPPRAVIDGPSSVDQGDTESEFDEAAVVAPGRTIVERRWDLDNDGEWDSTAEKVKLDTATVGYRSIRLWVKDSAGETDETSRTIAVRQPKDVSPPEPVVDPATNVHVGTTVNPYTGLSTITIPRGQVSALPNECLPLDINFTIKKSAGAVVENAKLLITKADGSILEVPMTDGDGDGVHTAHVDCAVSGTMRVQYSFVGDATEFTVDIGGIQLIDPQGVVYDRAKYDEELSKIGKTHATATEAEREAARSATAIAGATVTLQRLVDGQWTTVSENDPGIEPNVNPQVTGANGLYQWDVSAGTYRVVVVKDGYADVTSTQVVIPPPVLDLHIPLERNYAPVADFTLSKTEVARTDSVTLTSTATDVGGSIESYEWDVDGDGYDDGDTATLQKALTGLLGQRTIKLRVTDNEGAKAVAAKTVTVVNKAPSAGTIAVAPAAPTAGDSVRFTVSGGSDPDGNQLTFAWDVDGDGFDDGSGSSIVTTLADARTYTIRVRATDADGASATATKDVVVAKKPEQPNPADPQPSPPQDTTAPGLALAANAKQTIKTVLAKGLLLTGSCSEPCAVKVEVFVAAKTAKSLGIDKKAKKSVLIGKVAASLGQGAKTAVKVKFSAKVKKALKKAKKVKLAVKATATDAALNAATKALSLSLKGK